MKTENTAGKINQLSVYCAICDFAPPQSLPLMREVARRAGGRENERLQ